ncbi:PAS domain S-box protein [Formosa sediminum]|uniref:histidine kinase n=1 Tax=Formosa sediminum TaxID=2594004 RepID=A0A516GM96_9FLAO|nr:PAS domain-containing protein [Formosa sediminum]QDO92633.1 PAS domain S-box protein [Formosa sediminum]
MDTTQNKLLTQSEIGILLSSKIDNSSQLGPINTWSPFLIYTLNIILNSKQPQFLCWGDDALLFYNEAFYDNFIVDNNVHSYLLKPLKSIPLEVFTKLTPSIQTALELNNHITLDNFVFKLPNLNRTYWNINFTPLHTNSNQALGVLVHCINETPKIKATRKVTKLTSRFLNIVKHAPIGVLIISAKTKTVDTVNKKYKLLFNENNLFSIGDPFENALPDTISDLKENILNTFITGENFQLTETPVSILNNGIKKNHFFNFLGEAIKDDNDSISGLILATTEVTESVIAKQKVLESENKFKNVILQSPIPIAVFDGPNHVIKMANKTMLNDIWRKDPEACLNHPLLEVFPELKAQRFPELLDNVYKTGISYNEREAHATVEGNDGTKNFYFDFDYAPIFENKDKVIGIIVTAVDVTEKVSSRKKIEKTETRLRIATEAADLATWELDLINKDITYSKRLTQILGYRENFVLSKDFIRSRIVKEDLDTILIPAFENALKTGTYFYEVRARKKDESVIWIRTHGKVFYNEEGDPIKLFGTLREITSEKRNEQQLMENEQKFRLLADSMPQKIWTANTEGLLDYYNQTVYDFTGHTHESLNPSNWLTIVHPDDRKENVDLWTKSIETGEDFIMEHRFLRYDGQYRWQLSRAVPQLDSTGNIQRWVGTSTDIQDQKMFLQELERQVQDRTKLLGEANAKLEDSVEELQRMNEELQSFAYISSHDLQEPLRKIQIFSSRILDLEKDNLSETGTGYFMRMQNAAHRMQVLIKDLLTYSRTNTSTRAFEKTDLNSVIEEVKIDLRELIKDNQVTIETGNLCTIYAIPFQFIQLMNNLINNSIKFAKQDVPPVIKIDSVIDKGSTFKLEQLVAEGEYCHIKVSDNGIGIDPQYSEQIFDVFERLHTRTAYEGTGIGLAIVKKIVENHNGYIFAEGEENKGVTFNIYIPTDISTV